MKCPYYNEGECTVASKIAGIPVFFDERACKVCVQQENARDYNNVTVDIASYALIKVGQHERAREVLQNFHSKEKEKVGTELKKLINWFSWYKKVPSCSKCKDREERMNKWGKDGCRKNVKTIVGWLEESAREHGYPFSTKGAEALINLAIKKSKSN